MYEAVYDLLSSRHPDQLHEFDIDQIIDAARTIFEVPAGVWEEESYYAGLTAALTVIGRVPHTPDEYGEPMINMITASIAIDSLRVGHEPSS